MTKKTLYFAIALLSQLGMLAALPLSRDGASNNEPGTRTIWLSAQAANVQEVMRGSVLRLHYDIARLDERRRQGETVYVFLRQRADSTWAAMDIRATKPAELAEETVAIRGATARSWNSIQVLLQQQGDGGWQVDSLVVGPVQEPFGELTTHQTVARASLEQDYVDFGIGYYNIPENLRKRLVADIATHRDECAALVRVDPQGRASLLGFRVQNREYPF